MLAQFSQVYEAWRQTVLRVPYVLQEDFISTASGLSAMSQWTEVLTSSAKSGRFTTHTIADHSLNYQPHGSSEYVYLGWGSCQRSFNSLLVLLTPRWSLARELVAKSHEQKARSHKKRLSFCPERLAPHSLNARNLRPACGPRAIGYAKDPRWVDPSKILDSFVPPEAHIQGLTFGESARWTCPSPCGRLCGVSRTSTETSFELGVQEGDFMLPAMSLEELPGLQSQSLFGLSCIWMRQLELFTGRG